jgi:hypothetical protein
LHWMAHNYGLDVGHVEQARSELLTLYTETYIWWQSHGRQTMTR